MVCSNIIKQFPKLHSKNDRLGFRNQNSLILLIAQYKEMETSSTFIDCIINAKSKSLF